MNPEEINNFIISPNYDELFFEDILKNHLGDPTITVLSVTKEPDIKKGENFLSDIARIQINLTREESGYLINEKRSFILKCEPVNNFKTLKIVQERKLFISELQILRDLLPRIEIALGIRLGPKFVYGTDTPPRIIIMEDLIEQGFCVTNRLQGLSMPHAIMAIENLAKFHAGSVVLYEKNPETLKSFRQGVFGANTRPSWFLLLTKSLNRLCEEVTSWSDEGCTLAVNKLKNIVTSIDDRVRDAHNYEADEFCVLNHGDVWINNMLFIEDNLGLPLQQVFVDYQMVSFSSPAIDLLFFFGVNLALEYRGYGEEILLEIYSNTLTASMKNLRCKTDPPTMKHLKEAMYRRRSYAVMSNLFLLPRMMLEKNEILIMDRFLDHDTSQVNMYQKPDTIRAMKRILPMMNDGGYFDM